MTEQEPYTWKNWRNVVHEIIYEAETPHGKLFDVLLIIAIFASVIVVLLDSVAELNYYAGDIFYILEWVFTILFTIEYGLRVVSIARPRQYCLSFFGVVDLLSILPTYLSLFFAGAQSLLVIRTLRLMRVFRVLKLAHFLGEAQFLSRALYASRRKILVFLFTVINIVVIAGAMLYVLESDYPGFHNIPNAIYWAIVTVTTVGYGNIVPSTFFGKLLSSALMIIGYAIIAVPTGIFADEMRKTSGRVDTRACPSCSIDGHAFDAVFCKYCGSQI